MGKKRIIKETTEELLKEAGETAKKPALKPVPSKAKKGKIRQMERARIFIQSSYNNTIVTLVDLQGRVLAWASAGSVGFRGPKKATPFAASKIIEHLMEKIRMAGIREVAVFVKGVGSGRESAIRALASQGLEIGLIKDITPIPHNGCRPRKPRRV